MSVEAKDPFARWVVHSAETDCLQAVAEDGGIGTAFGSQLVEKIKDDGSFPAGLASGPVSLIKEGDGALNLTFLGVVGGPENFLLELGDGPTFLKFALL